MGVYIPNMKKSKRCGECDLWSYCFYPKNPYTEQDDYIAPDCELIEIDHTNTELLEFYNEFMKWKASKAVAEYINAIYGERRTDE